MDIAAELLEARVSAVRITEGLLIVDLVDGRTLTVPVAWYPRLAYGTSEERTVFQLIGGGIGIHWPWLDEDISIEALLLGRKSREGAESLRKWKENLEAHRNKKSNTPPRWGEFIMP